MRFIGQGQTFKYEKETKILFQNQKFNTFLVNSVYLQMDVVH